ncbi:helix-turn-helix domain-containing protein [Halobacteriovorax sp. GB3]|uniref:helix-turn-helix domain-containing protein n=1 Tax=Halobacteriovorax sp. GB3 TaxID=2719615 RepID=UPI0023619260|nr:helix-turn-helix domain-containing protein [Halobacteriovorax sp. GB3]MDD0851734.1 helix-turn-helix domain-containing protein [Halobacteriovorax sp. GB3]
MQYTPTRIHILDDSNTLKSITYSFYDHFMIAKKLIHKSDFLVTNQSKSPLSPKENVDFLILPPSFDIHLPTKKEANLIHRAISDKKYVIACCGGVLKLASLGLLDGKKATTHRIFQNDLLEKYPNIKPALNHVLIEQGKLVTAGGLLSYLDVICFIIKKVHGIKVARSFNHFLQGPGIREYQPTYQENEKRPVLYDYFSRANPEQFTLEECSHHYKMSKRSFQRYLKEKYDCSFREILKTYRLYETKKLIGKKIPIKEISFQLGFIDDVSFRRFFKKEMQMSISRYRELQLIF